MILVTSVEVERMPLGYSTFARCVAHQETDGSLTIISIDDRAELSAFLPGSWREANIRDDRGVVVDYLRARVPHHDLSSHLFDTAVTLAKVGRV